MCRFEAVEVEIPADADRPRTELLEVFRTDAVRVRDVLERQPRRLARRVRAAPSTQLVPPP